MGGSTVRYELENLDALLLYPDVYEKSPQTRWISYFEKMQGFNEVEVLDFSQNLTEGYSMVHGVRIPMTEETVAAMIGFPTTGTRWFIRKAHLPEAQKGFLMDDEQVQTKYRGADVSSLPKPWGKVS
jgi:hypothetical protein